MGDGAAGACRPCRRIQRSCSACRRSEVAATAECGDAGGDLTDLTDEVDLTGVAGCIGGLGEGLGEGLMFRLLLEGLGGTHSVRLGRGSPAKMSAVDGVAPTRGLVATERLRFALIRRLCIETVGRLRVR